MQSESEYRDIIANKRRETGKPETQIGKIQRSGRLQMSVLPPASYGLKDVWIFPLGKNGEYESDVAIRYVPHIYLLYVIIGMS